ncbi:MAG: hypothetical protein AVDCRST_MAG68-2053, partial [uncultured Gemmatimonadetes bacterium]
WRPVPSPVLTALHGRCGTLCRGSTPTGRSRPASTFRRRWGPAGSCLNRRARSGGSTRSPRVGTRRASRGCGGTASSRSPYGRARPH